MKLWIKIVIAVIVLGLLAGIYVYKFMYNKAKLNYANEKAAYSLKVGDLYNEFKKDLTTAGSKYTGKVLEIDGAVTKLETTDSTCVAIFVFNQGDFGDEGVRCSILPDFAAKAKKFSPGNNVKLKGLCTGFNSTDVVLEKGSIVE